jgi:heptaprenyl diphosphate synthase
MPLPSKTKRLTTLALLGALALVLSWVDSLIPVSGVLPGAKLGLANLTVLAGLYLLGPVDALGLSLLKILLSTALFGNAFSFFYALAGGALSYLVMVLLRKWCSTVFVSVMGGMFHNLGQIVVAALVLQTAGLLSYLPVLLLCGLGAGFAIGLAGGILISRLRQALAQEQPPSEPDISA